MLDGQNILSFHGTRRSVPITVKKPLRSVWQTVVVDGFAATAAFVLAKMIS